MWVSGWCSGTLGDTPPSNDVIPPHTRVQLLGRGTCPLIYRDGRLSLATLVGLRSGICFVRATFASFHFTQPQ